LPSIGVEIVQLIRNVEKATVWCLATGLGYSAGVERHGSSSECLAVAHKLIVQSLQVPATPGSIDEFVRLVGRRCA
jgi:hypothetical protein